MSNLNKIEVSLVTPVYNESQNLDNLYLDLCKQEGVFFEWVLIDDGSTDNSVDTIKKIIEFHDSNNFKITLIEQCNSGAAAARRAGIAVAASELVAILDADDKISHDALRLALDKFKDDIDIVCFQLSICNKDGSTNSEFTYSPKTWPISGRQGFSQCIDSWGLTGLFMIRKSLFKSVYEVYDNYITTNTVSGDEFISRLCMYFARMIDICDGRYFYFINDSSTTRAINENYYKTIFTSLSLHDFINDHGEDDSIKKSQRNLLHTFRIVLKKYNKDKKEMKNRDDWIISLVELAKKINISLVIKEEAKARRLHRTWKQILFVFVLKFK